MGGDCNKEVGGPLLHFAPTHRIEALTKAWQAENIGAPITLTQLAGRTEHPCHKRQAEKTRGYCPVQHPE